MKTVLALARNLLVAIFLLSPCLSMAAEMVDHRPWSELLASHVRQGRVDYPGFKKDEARLDGYLEILQRSRPEGLARADRLAFFINAYNAWTVKLILMHFRDGRPVASIKDIGGLFSSPWSLKICRVAGEVLSLDDIEHDIIRPEFKDPRVHFAVNCASKSCPALLDTAYTGERLEEQLDGRAAFFINDSRYNYLQGDTLYLSRLFSWFANDFGDIKQFILHHADSGLKEGLQKVGSAVKVEYLDYDWTINSR